MMENRDNNKYMLQLFALQIAWGALGTLRRYMQFTSPMIALLRGLIGSLTMLIITCAKYGKINVHAIKSNLPKLLISGGLIGINWILLFEAYRITKVPIVDLFYNLVPFFTIISSPLVTGEKISFKKFICVLIAMVGLSLVVGFDSSLVTFSDFKGIFLATMGAVIYCSVIYINKNYKDELGNSEKSIMQLAMAGIVTIPYSVAVGDFILDVDLRSWILVIIMGIVFTGLAYTVYYKLLSTLSAQSMAISCFIDPLAGIVIAAIVLHETLTTAGIFGAVLLLGASIISEFEFGNKGRKKIEID